MNDWRDDAGDPSATAEFADALNRAIRNKGLTLERVRARLGATGTPVSIATLSYWQTGRSLPTRSASLKVVTELERILGLEEGTLSDLVTDQRRRRQHDLQDWEAVVPSPDIVARLISDMGLDPTGDLTRLTLHDSLTIAADRTESTELTRLVLRSERTGACRWAVVYEQDADPGVIPQVEAVSGCMVGETVVIPERNLTIAEMILPRPLERGEMALVEIMVTWAPTDVHSFRVERSCVTAMRELALEVKFHKSARPRRAVAYQRPQMEGETEYDLVELPIGPGPVQSIRHDANPGVYGVRWEWD
ncbi:hypothetical protein [Mariniluteicoccus flavus]